METLIITGQSGAGKTQTAAILEDLGYYCIDNMPIKLIPDFIKMGGDNESLYGKAALIVDVRGGYAFEGFFEMLELVRAMDCECKLFFMEADEETIIRRYKETRRKHPMQRDGEPVEQAIARETVALQPIRGRADYIFNTSNVKVSDLRMRLSSILEKIQYDVVASVTTFGYKYGLPKDIDMLFDARFLPNPFYIPDLKEMSGLDAPVREFLDKTPQMDEFCRMLFDMINFMLNHCKAEGRSNLSVGIGCTGGRHRSVAVAKALFEHLENDGYKVILSHRDMEK